MTDTTDKLDGMVEAFDKAVAAYWADPANEVACKCGSGFVSTGWPGEQDYCDDCGGQAVINNGTEEGAYRHALHAIGIEALVRDAERVPALLAHIAKLEAEVVGLRANAAEEDRAHTQTIAERDHMHEIIDELCDAVLGTSQTHASGPFSTAGYSRTA